MWWSWQREKSETIKLMTLSVLRPSFLQWSNLISSCIIERKTHLGSVWPPCLFLVWSFIGAPQGLLQGTLRSLGSQAVGFSPLTPVNRLHKFCLPTSKSAMLFVLLSSFSLSSCCWLLSCSFVWRLNGTLFWSRFLVQWLIGHLRIGTFNEHFV